MSALAATKKAPVNLGQGFPDFNATRHCRCRDRGDALGPQPVIRRWRELPALRTAIASKIEALYGYRYNAEHEITVTAGGRLRALLTHGLRWCIPGDEVIVIEPVYDSYGLRSNLAGGGYRYVAMGTAPTMALPFERIAAAISPKPG